MADKPTPPYVLRMVEESKQLIDRLDNLNAFICDRGSIYAGLPQEKKDLLLQQRECMHQYSVILTRRLELELA